MLPDKLDIYIHIYIYIYTYIFIYKVIVMQTKLHRYSE